MPPPKKKKQQKFGRNITPKDVENKETNKKGRQII